jgi:hypothetical protein
MYPPMDHYSKARQEQLLRTVDQGQSSSVGQVDMHRPKEHGFIYRLISALFRRKSQTAAISSNYGKESQELRRA